MKPDYESMFRAGKRYNVIRLSKHSIFATVQTEEGTQCKVSLVGSVYGELKMYTVYTQSEWEKMENDIAWLGLLPEVQFKYLTTWTGKRAPKNLYTILV